MLYQNHESNIEIEKDTTGFEIRTVSHRGHRTLIVWKPFFIPLGEWIKIPSSATGEYVRSAEALLRPNGTIFLKVFHGNAYSDNGFVPTYYVMKGEAV